MKWSVIKLYKARSIAAGMAIGLAGLLNCYLGGGLQGAIAFGLGLLVVLALKLDLFTGKMRAWYNKEVNWKEMIIIFLGNGMGIFFMYCFGTALPGYLHIKETATAIMAARSELTVGFVFIRAMLCGVCVQMAVDMWNKNWFAGNAHPFLAMLPASAFVLLGCNHCIADLLYLFYSDAFVQGWQILEAIIGNIAGAMLFVAANSSKKDDPESPSNKQLLARQRKNSDTPNNVSSPNSGS